MTHGRFDLIDPYGGPTRAARVLLALSRVDRSEHISIPTICENADVGRSHGMRAMTELTAQGYLEPETGFGHHRLREYRLTARGVQMARGLARLQRAKKPPSRS